MIHRLLFALLLLNFILHSPLNAMEQPDESAPLLEEVIVDNAQEQYPTALYDGSREYYDSAAQRKDTIKQYVKAGKNCLKLTAFWSGLIVTAMTVGWLAVDTIIFGIVAIRDDFHGFSYSAQEYAGILSGLMPWEVGISTAFTIPMSATFGFTKTIFPLLYSEPRTCCLYEGLREFYFDELIISHENEISPELIAAADNEKKMFDKKEIIYKLVETNRIKYWKLRRTIFPSDRAHAKLIPKIEKRLQDVSPLRDAYRKTAYLLKKYLKSQLGRDPVQYLSQYFPRKNILLHVLAHHKEFLWSLDYSYLTEQEWLMLRNPTKRYLPQYEVASFLADRGWCAFSSSEKYPIRCHMKYFDEQAHELHFRYVLQSQLPNPTIFIPYNQDISRYYKFEEDPHYTSEFENPSNEKIRRLLTLRQDLIAQRAQNNALQQLQNNNN